jgi:hypothetical protein
MTVMSVICAGRLWTQKIPWYSFLLAAETMAGSKGSRKIRSIEISTKLIANRTRDLWTHSTMLQPSTLPSVPALIKSQLRVCYRGLHRYQGKSTTLKDKSWPVTRTRGHIMQLNGNHTAYPRIGHTCLSLTSLCRAGSRSSSPGRG